MEAAPANSALGAVTVMDAAAISGLTDAQLLSSADAALAQYRAAGAAVARYVGEIAERSRAELGRDGLARRAGHPNAPTLIASTGRIGRSEAAKLCRVGAATAPRFSIAGERLPAAFPALAEGLADGSVSTDGAYHIITHLDLARPRAELSDMIAAEVALVQFATTASADDVRRVAVTWREHLDTDGIEPREAQLVAQRSLKRFWLPNGLRRLQWDQDPETAAFTDAALDAEIAAAFRRVRFTDLAAASDADADVPVDVDLRTGSVLDDLRTVAQIGSDALTGIIRHALSCENTTPSLATTTVLVRMPLEALDTGKGAATIGTEEHPISAGTARRLAADADIIPVVLGGQSEILDLGRKRRAFSKAQKLALMERDGGCVCGCDRAPVFLEAHHSKWWERDRGETNLNLGVMVCSKAHAMIHHHGWDIGFIEKLPYLIPPRTIDPSQKPRRGGRPPTPHRLNR